MEIKKDTQMVVVDAEGKEHLMQILFTYENEERGTKYVFFYDTEDPEENVIAMRYIGELDSGELEPIEDDDEYDEVEEVFNAWQEETIFVKVDNLSGANGSFNANISNVTQHNYSRHMYFDSNYHRSICLCGAYIFEEHIYQLGNNNCIICTPLLLNGLSESNESDITVLSYD